jgi:RND family efflux transporter MFP subunit
MSGRRAVLALLAVGLLAWTACGKSDAQAPAAPQGKAAPGKAAPSAAQPVKPIVVNVARAESREVQRSVETIGSLLALDEVVVKTEQPGTVAKLFADLGDRVTRGQILAEYDAREFQLAVAQAEADLLSSQQTLDRTRAALRSGEAALRRAGDSLASLEAEVARTKSQVEWTKSELDRNTELWKKELIAARDVDNARYLHNVAQAHMAVAENARSQHPDQVHIAQAQVESDRAALRVAEAEVARREAALGIFKKRLGDTTVRAPIAGSIARRHLSAGEYVKENTPVFTVVTLDPLKYTGTVPERYVPDLRVGQPLELAVEAYTGRNFPGQVTRLAPAVDVQTRTLALEGRVANPDGRLRPGFFAKGSVLTRKEGSVAFVPADAVISFVGITKVFVVAGGKVEERAVKPGARQGAAVEIVDGVKSGETVAVSNLSQLFNGAPVTVVESRAGK